MKFNSIVRRGEVKKNTNVIILKYVCFQSDFFLCVSLTPQHNANDNCITFLGNIYSQTQDSPPRPC